MGGLVLEVWVEVDDVVFSEIGVEIVVGGLPLALGFGVVAVFD